MQFNRRVARFAVPARSGEVIAVLPVAVVLVVVLALAYVSTISPAGLHTWSLMGDVDTAAALVVAGSLFFPTATVIASRLDRLGTPRVADHFKQCSLLYIVVIVATVALVRGRDARGSVGYGVGGVVAVAASIGVIENAITLLVRGWRARAI